MTLRVAIPDLHLARADVDAFACVDLLTGAVLGVTARDPRALEAIEHAARASSLLYATPGLDGPDEQGSPVHEALVVSESGVYAIVRSTRAPDWVVVGVARGQTNVALLLTWLHGVAEAISAEVP